MSATEELSLTFDDIEGPITLPVLEDRVEEVVEENLVYREAFRPYDANNISSNVVQIPVPEDEQGRVTLVEEGAEFPRSHEEYELKEMYFDKFGFEVPLTMEAVADSRIDLTQDQIDRQAWDMSKDMNERAFNHMKDAIEDERDNAHYGGDSGELTYNDILEGRQALVSDSYNPDLLIADVQGVHDLLRSDNFLRATDVGDRMRREGAVGRIAGMEVMEDDTGLTPGDDAHSAVMIDTNYFGYEGERDPIQTEEYGEDRSQTEVKRIFTRMGWLPTQPESGVIIQG